MNLSLLTTNISKNYNGIPVLEGCTYSFNKKEIYVLTGENGSGKSTFLRICALLESADGGSVFYLSDGEAIENDMALRRRITIVLPRIGVFNTSVIKNVLYGMAIRGVRHKEAEQQALEALEFVGLKDKRDQNALTLSSGETQRLGIARALVIKPEILFLDEPTASVDRKNTEIIEGIIARLGAASQTIVIMTTHDQAQAERLAGKRIEMKDGRLFPL